MNTGETVRTALGEIRHHKMRSTLTLLGIILGTLSITVMTSFLNGIVGAVYQGFDDLGFDGVMYVVGRDARDLREQAIFARSEGLQPRDGGVLLARAKAISMVAPAQFTEELVRANGVERRARVMGVTSTYADVRSRKLAAGRFVREADEQSYARVCVIGHRVAKRFFGSDDPLGKRVAIGSRSFQVIGVGRKLGNMFVDDDEFVEEMEGLYVPLSTLRKFYVGDGAQLTFLAVKTADIEDLGTLKAEAIDSLRIAHRGAKDFQVQNIAEEMLKARKEVAELIQNWYVVLGSIAGISLLVGGIGLLSVMLISINERLYEIGLRKAIGATDFEVFFQFLSESVTLSLIGAMIGAGIGVALTVGIARFFPAGMPVNVAGLLTAIGVAIALGIIFGVYPALKASRMAPVDALRTAG